MCTHKLFRFFKLISLTSFTMHENTIYVTIRHSGLFRTSSFTISAWITTDCNQSFQHNLYHACAETNWSNYLANDAVTYLRIKNYLTDQNEKWIGKYVLRKIVIQLTDDILQTIESNTRIKCNVYIFTLRNCFNYAYFWMNICMHSKHFPDSLAE